MTGDLDTDVAIVGGGFTGLSTALHLAERGIEAQVLEARTIGYGGVALMVALLTEALLYGAVGGLLGVALARFAISGASVSLAMQAFALEVGPAAVLAGFASSLTLSALGAVPPALRAARMPVIRALRDA